MPAGSEINKHLRSRGQEDQLASKANSAVIASTNSNSEEVTYKTGGSGSKAPVSHPYIGPNSWLRVMPERGTRCMIARRAEDGDPYISAYFSENNAESAAKLTDQGNFYYRSLREGETNITSPGIADIFTSRRGTLELRGGATSLHLAHEDLEIRARAPTHTRAILGNKRQEVGDEERFGVVVRPGSLNVKFPGQPTVRNIIETVPLFYAKEYLRILRSDGPIPGVVLAEHREGDVYDDTGRVLTNSSGVAVRAMSKYGTSLPGITTDFEVDVNGNITISLPVSASKGLAIDVLGPGNIDITVGKDFLLSAIKAITLAATTGISMESKATIDVTSLGKQTFDAPLIALGKGADTPGVRGQDLMNWLVSHTHPTGVGPSGPPINPPPPTILSTVVTLK
jgi:hypothetical protein